MDCKVEIFVELVTLKRLLATRSRPIHFSKDRLAEKTSELTPKEVSCLRAVNGSLNWLATQSRPDLATQASFSQQAFPKLTVLDALAANHAVRRAKQHSDQELRFVSNDPTKIAVMCHSDAAFANAKAGATQAGYSPRHGPGERMFMDSYFLEEC